MAGSLQPLDEKFAIVGPDGRPTLYFIKWAQQRQIDITDGITLADLEAFLTAHKLVPGTGIQITPDGDINNSPTIHADVQAILDEVTATRGAMLYRGLLGWSALLPGTAGNLLQTNGAGADPTWVVPPSGGGGAVTKIASQTLAVAAASISFTGIPATYSDLIVVLNGRGDSAATFVEARLRFNNDIAANYDFESNLMNNATNTSGGTVGATSVFLGWIPAATGVASAASSCEITVPNYAGTTFHKDLRSRGGLRTGAAAANLFSADVWGDWRSAAAINRVDLFPSAGNFLAGSRATLYGRG